ncbi:calycin-like domain-containing protein [Phocaeicola sp.]
MNIKTATGAAVGDPVTGQKISLTKVSDSKVKLVLANFSFSGITLGNIEADCTATFDAKDNEYDLVGSTTLDLSAVGLGTLGITISGDADNRELDVDITVSDVPVFNVIKVDFEGTK